MSSSSPDLKRFKRMTSGVPYLRQSRGCLELVVSAYTMTAKELPAWQLLVLGAKAQLFVRVETKPSSIAKSATLLNSHFGPNGAPFG
jgi:hypothetical protein